MATVDLCRFCFAMKVGGVCRTCFPNAPNAVKTNTSSEAVRQIALELHAVCAEHDKEPAQLLTAIAWAAVSACKSFGISEDEFIANFRKLMAGTGELVDEPMLIRGGR